jgi:hypothetical protein
MYEKQTHSKYARELDRRFGLIFKTDELQKELYKKHFKKQYAGKPTKKYLQISCKLRQADEIDMRELELLIRG